MSDSLPKLVRRHERIAELRQLAEEAKGNTTHWTSKDGRENEAAQPAWNAVAKLHSDITKLLEQEWKQLGDEPKTAAEKRELADRLEQWAAQMRAEADKETT